jgi:hypothetical protein
MPCEPTPTPTNETTDLLTAKEVKAPLARATQLKKAPKTRVKSERHVLLVESDKGWWDGKGRWVQTWGQSMQFDDGADWDSDEKRIYEYALRMHFLQRRSPC